MAQSTWYQPNSAYGSEQNWYTTPFTKDYMDPQLPKGVFTAYLANNNLGTQNRESMYARSLEGQANSGYQAAQLNNPGLTFRNYLNRYMGPDKIHNLWLSLAPSQRGENAAQFAPKARWVARG